MEVRTDPSGEFLGCLVRQVPHCGIAHKETAGDLLSPSVSECRLQVGAVPGKIGGCTAETGEEKNQEGKKEETKGGRRGGGGGAVAVCGLLVHVLMFAGCAGGGDSEVYCRGRAAAGAHCDLQN